MGYMPKTWESDTPILYADLAHIEEQYTEIMNYLNSHNHDDRYYLKATADSYFWNTGREGSGSGLNADTLEGEHEGALAGGVELGVVIWYWGTLSEFTNKRLSVDTTWHIADGTDGTIDLLDYFVLGAGGAYAVGDTGGNSQFKPDGTISITSHVLTVLESMHTHAMTDYYGSGAGGGAADAYPGTIINFTTTYTPLAGTTSAVGSNAGHDHPGSFAGNWSSLMPPFVALIPIQKMS